MAVLDRSTLEANNDAVFTTNGARAITGAQLNGYMTDVLDSYLNITDDVSADPDLANDPNKFATRGVVEAYVALNAGGLAAGSGLSENVGFMNLGGALSQAAVITAVNQGFVVNDSQGQGVADRQIVHGHGLELVAALPASFSGLSPHVGGIVVNGAAQQESFGYFAGLDGSGFLSKIFYQELAALVDYQFQVEAAGANAGANMLAINGGNLAQVSAKSDGRLEFTTTGGASSSTFTDAAGFGLMYGGDYAAAQAGNARWIPDKGYVDGVVANGPFWNLSGTSTLTALTTIEMAANGLIFNGGDTAWTVNLVDVAPGNSTSIALNNPLGQVTLIGAKSDFSQSATITAIPAGASLNYGELFTFKSLTVSDAGMVITDDIDSAGLVYFADYSAANAANPRWVPDKAYVDGVAGGGGWALTGTTNLTGSVLVSGSDAMRYRHTDIDGAAGVGEFGLYDATDGFPGFGGEGYQANFQNAGGTIVKTLTIPIGTDAVQMAYADFSTFDINTVSTDQNNVTLNHQSAIVNTSQIRLASGGIEMDATGAINIAGQGTIDLIVTSTGGPFVITDGRVAAAGVEYAADYSANFSARSLVDRNYVQTLPNGVNASTAGNGYYFTDTAGGGISFTDNGQGSMNFLSDGGSIFMQDDAGAGSGFIQIEAAGDAGGRMIIGAVEGVPRTSAMTLDIGTAIGADGFTTQFIDTTPTPTGIEYAADYSATFVDRSLVDKAYVDSMAGGIPGGFADLALDTGGVNYAIPANVYYAVIEETGGSVVTFGLHINDPDGSTIIVLNNKTSATDITIGQSVTNGIAGGSFNLSPDRAVIATKTGGPGVDSWYFIECDIPDVQAS